MSATPTYRFAGVVALLLAALATETPVRADDAPAFSSAVDAYRTGRAAQDAGKADAALQALEFAADRGVLGAQLKLARMYASGDGAKRDHGKAFFYYQRIADQFADASSLYPVGRYAAEAFVAVGRYYQSGIEEIGLRPNAPRAADMFRHAASYFGDPNAQYRLAILYLEGVGVQKNQRLAVNWLANTTKKQHAASQALLGDILWRGREDIRRQPHKGLALLTLARENANGTEDDGWIAPMFERALSEASAPERDAAMRVVAHWRQRPPAPADVTAIDDENADAPGKGQAPESDKSRKSDGPQPDGDARPSAALAPAISNGAPIR